MEFAYRYVNKNSLDLKVRHCGCNKYVFVFAVCLPSTTMAAPDVSLLNPAKFVYWLSLGLYVLRTYCPVRSDYTSSPRGRC